MLDYILEKYKKTKFPNVYLQEIKNAGVFDKEEAMRLYNEGIISVSRGMHGKLIILEKTDGL